jgi:hypothetical protein
VLKSAELEDIALRNGRSRKSYNAIVAALSGILPGVISGFLLHPSWERCLIGFAIGLIWGNAFEYSYHRWMLHRPRGAFAKGHLEHHMSVGTVEEPEHVALGRSPAHIALLFVSNGVLVTPIDLLLRLHVIPGIFVGWAVYLIIAEDVHWRIHMNGWLPPGLRFARAYHLSHHDYPNVRYNVLLPLFDLLLGNSGLSHKSGQA